MSKPEVSQFELSRNGGFVNSLNNIHVEINRLQGDIDRLNNFNQFLDGSQQGGGKSRRQILEGDSVKAYDYDIAHNSLFVVMTATGRKIKDIEKLEKALGLTGRKPSPAEYDYDWRYHQHGMDIRIVQ